MTDRGLSEARALLRWWAGQRYAERSGYPAPLGEQRESMRTGVPCSRPPRGVGRGEEYGRTCALIERARAADGPAMAICCAWYLAWYSPTMCAARHESGPAGFEALRVACDRCVRENFDVTRDEMRELRRRAEALIARMLLTGIDAAA